MGPSWRPKWLLLWLQPDWDSIKQPHRLGGDNKTIKRTLCLYFKKLVVSLSEQYDRVIIDSAPMNPVSDALILATMADSLVYVATADSTPYNLVLKNINLIRHSNLPLTGVVLNKFDAKKQNNYGKDGYSDSYYGYGHS